MVQEPHQEIQEKWDECKKSWTKINQAMRDIGLLEFSKPDDFVELHDMVKLHVKQESSWAAEREKVVKMARGQVKKFMEHPMSTWTMLQQLSAKVVKYQARVVEIKEILSTPMDQHIFL
jgi:alpha-amylase/alpha-mannosidase (GH57 family)